MINRHILIYYARSHARFFLIGFIACSILFQPVRSPAASPPDRKLVIVLVIDGLRPDSITQADTPNLFQLRSQGVSYENTHSVFPTVTRVNAAALVTGAYPTRNGLVSNSMYVPEVNPSAPFT